VANRQDGSVQVVAEGEEAVLQQLVSWLQHGPPSAQVIQVEKTWGDGTGEFHSFQVRY
jgi:acylphosphatase